MTTTRRARTTKCFLASYVPVFSVAPSVRSTRAPVLDLLASVLQAAKPLIHFGSAQAPAPIKRVSRREILIKVALRVAQSQIKALFRPFYESCISEPPNSFFG